MRIIVWDLDETILDTGRLFKLADERVSREADMSVKDVRDIRRRIARINFTFHAWFDALGIDPYLFSRLEQELTAELSALAPVCVYPGVRQIIEMHDPSRETHVLLTAGDPAHQVWKFSLLGLHEYFEVRHRHVVPRNASKANVLARYFGYGQVIFIDNQPDWHAEVLEQGIGVTQIRPRWPDSSTAEPHHHDGVRWHVVDSPEELVELLRK